MKFTEKRFRWFVLIPVVAVAGGVWGGYYNATEPARAAQDSAVIRAAADVSVAVPAADTSDSRAVTMPFRNDSPDPVTLTSLILPFADQMTWTPVQMTLQPGQTGYPLVMVPAQCLSGLPAAGSGPLRTAPVKHSATEQQVTTVYMKVNTIDGNTHGITLGATGALAVAAYNCGKVTVQ
ncbi:MAG TPA: hypothetical protein VGX23_06475 [Actinocrinis sp.]|nr:hypothetical protein [Actinocrinis sp.]